ncbi:hypothetical protein MARA_39990 [Mycolicibacterium arabiense]|uniref:Integral membrane protein n=1 Tax=Mycolicibacterium arabiense TaxID=1286181 RepID=A0A7I7S2B7_9MYCO|nr:hypothetical protein [Mycolicibacterium arabiense]MCV7371818.1 hypothetical protein [Mycolicibacterium arabiense]BBY50531.1 hypothetical protein MARA_39990 [Mycolicibacterium arabiense]
MSAATSRAGALCGALVGACSASLTGAAHAAAGGGLPGGSGVVVLALVCSAVGAATSAGLRDGRRQRLAVLAAGLAAGQTLGHLVLTMTAHHGMGGAWPPIPMLLAHGTAAVALAALIGLAGHLYTVGASVLAWLSPTIVHRGRPTTRRWRSTPIGLRSRLLPGGTRMRAPPRAVAIPG